MIYLKRQEQNPGEKDMPLYNPTRFCSTATTKMLSAMVYSLAQAK